MIFKAWCIANSSACRIEHWDSNFQLKFIEFLSICFVSCDNVLKSFSICQKSFQFFIKVVRFTAVAVEFLFFTSSVYNMIWFWFCWICFIICQYFIKAFSELCRILICISWFYDDFNIANSSIQMSFWIHSTLEFKILINCVYFSCLLISCQFW